MPLPQKANKEACSELISFSEIIMASRRQRKMSRHLAAQLPRLLQLAQAPLPETSFWESEALLCLRATIRPGSGGFIQQEILRLLRQHQQSIPALMSLDVTINPRFDSLLESWYKKDVADRRSSTLTPTPNDDDVCPVCLIDAPTQTTVCGHKFCEQCLDICARARPREALLCPLCRRPLKAPLELPEMNLPQRPPPGFTAVDHMLGPSTFFSQGRPRVNEFWLDEDELNIYLGYYVPILDNTL